MTEAATDYVAIVRAAVAEALGIEETEVEPAATILGDLGAESIDLLDVLFRIEQVAGVKIQTSDIADLLQGGLSDEEFEGSGGIITPAGLDQLRKVLPQIDTGELAGKLVAEDIITLFTVTNLADMVAQRAAEAVHAR
jgi:acyl carrier protein